MGVTNGSSVVGLQTLQNLATLTVNRVAVFMTSQVVVKPDRVGYLYLWCVDNAAPNRARLILRSPVYGPGTYLEFPATLGFSAVKYTVQVEWNRPGLPWQCSTG